MKKIKITILAILCTINLYAQFNGGSGSGYSAANFNPNAPLSLNNIYLFGYSVDHAHKIQWGIQEYAKDQIKSISLQQAGGQLIWNNIFTTKPNDLEVLYNNQKLLEGTNYYRLEIVSKRNTKTYSNIISLNNRIKNKIKIYPNPTTNILTVTYADIHSIAILNLEGKTVIERTFDNLETVNLSLESLVKGVYFMVINKQEIHRFIKR